MGKNLKTLFPYVWKYKYVFLASAISLLFTNGLSALFPLVLQRSIDAINTHITRGQLAYSCLLIAAVACSQGIFQFLARWLLNGLSRNIEYDLRNDLFRHLELLSFSYYQKTRTGDIMARATNDLNAVRMLAGPAIMSLANSLFYALPALCLMWHIHHRLTSYVFAILIIFCFVMRHFGRELHERFQQIQEHFSEISSRTQENFSSSRVIRAYVQEEAEIALFEKFNQEYLVHNVPLMHLTALLFAGLELMMGLALILVMWLGSREVLLHRITLGQFTAFFTYVLQLTWPVIAFGWVMNIFQRGVTSMGRINEILTAPVEITNAHATCHLLQTQPIAGEIEFCRLNFSYDGIPVLHDINLRIPAGSSLAIVGPTGSGKSTFVALIPRIYDAQPGTLLLDGRPLREYPLEMLRHNIGFVPQETFLFSDTVRENISFGAEGAGMREIQVASQVAGIATDIESFPDQYDTVIGERGITMSGGQKQRTAIARAMIRNPRILILDDALSSVDIHNEEQILTHLRQAMRGRTTIFISHRVSTVQAADQIAVLNQGRIAELGTHDELLSRNGYYTDLYNKQLQRMELDQL